MVMIVEIAGMAGDAFAAASNRRRDEGAAARAVAGGATLGGMDLANADERCGGGGVAANAIGRAREGGDVLFDLGRVVVIVFGKVAGVTLIAGAAVAAIDSGIAIAVSTYDACAVDTGVTGEASTFVDTRDDLPAMAVHTGGGDSNCCRMIMAVARVIGR